MDYLFDESYNDEGSLSEFVTVSDSVAPFAGGFFLVTPEEGEFERIIDIVRRHRNRKTNATIFDSRLGWGHVIAPNDPWKAWFYPGNSWTFYAVHSDQGILYHWIRYERGNYTWIDTGSMETWRTVNAADVAYWQNKSNYAVPKISGNRQIARVQKMDYAVAGGPLKAGCGAPQLDRHGWAKYVPFRDYYHFAGGAKPWFKPVFTHNITCPHTDPNVTIKTGLQFWLCELKDANSTLGLNIPSPIVLKEGKNPLGAWDPKRIPHLLQPGLELPKPSNKTS
mmetsp:Transcript_1545/g.2388  ORF Transcript_1545/g.2388 Transcript_1545/m.2388 type:complete len:280 (+) Transcript_1545:3-842(+)